MAPSTVVATRDASVPNASPATPRRAGRFGRLRRLFWLAVAASLLSSCTLSQGSMYSVQSGFGIYMHIFQKPSEAIVLLHFHACGASIVCTSNWLRQNVEVRGWGAAEWRGGLKEYEDFRGAIHQVKDHGKCIALHKNGFGTLNWTRSSSSSWCKVGTLDV